MHLIIGVSIVLIITAVLAVTSALSRAREKAAAMEHATRELLTRLQSLEDRAAESERTFTEAQERLREYLAASARAEREEIARNFASLGEAQSRHLREVSSGQKDSLELLAGQLTQLTRSNEARLDALRESVENRLKELQSGNEEKLEKMRAVVDEKLHATLEQRLGAAFANVSEWLDKVHQGLGEMKNLAGDVGDLRKVLTNVKTRGIWGEIQLGSLLEQILQRSQYEENVAVIPGASERVEFAIRLPGRDELDERGERSCVWLPIDSKFPQEDYLRLIEASERCDQAAIAEHRKALERRVLDEAKKIREKYIEVPYTTDFGILFLPVEGLYSEVVRIDGLCERLTREYRVVVAGPTTVAALLNSLQMGFRTLAVEKRSSEVWLLLGQVKTEFSKFGTALEKVHNRIEQAGKDLEDAGKRTRAIERKLRNVSMLESEPLSAEIDSAIAEGEMKDE